MTLLKTSLPIKGNMVLHQISNKGYQYVQLKSKADRFKDRTRREIISGARPTKKSLYDIAERLERSLDIPIIEATILPLERHQQDAHVTSEATCVDRSAPEASTPSQEKDSGKEHTSRDLFGWIPFSPRTRGLIMLNVLVLLVSTNWVVIKESEAAFDPFAFAFLRFSVASVALSPFLLQLTSKSSTLVKAGVELGLYTAAGYLLQSLGLESTDASRASFISTFTVLVVPLLAGLQGRGINPITWVASFTALAGVGLLERSGTPPCLGDVWSFLSAVAFGVQVYRTEHWSRKLDGDNDTLPLMAVVLVTTMVVSGGAALTTNYDYLMHVVGNGWGGLNQTLHTVPWNEVFYTGLLTTDVALLLEMFALKTVPSTDAAIVYTAEPLLGAGLAAYCLGERWGPSGWVGAALILGSCGLTQVYGATLSEDSPRKNE